MKSHKNSSPEKLGDEVPPNDEEANSGPLLVLTIEEVIFKHLVYILEGRDGVCRQRLVPCSGVLPESGSESQTIHSVRDPMKDLVRLETMQVVNRISSTIVWCERRQLQFWGDQFIHDLRGEWDVEVDLLVV